MLKKLSPAILALVIMTHQVHCADTELNNKAIEQQELKSEELKKIEAKKKRRKKIIIATAITASIAAMAATLATVNIAPNYCPTFIRKCMPNWSIKKTAQLEYLCQDYKEILKNIEKIENEAIKKSPELKELKKKADEWSDEWEHRLNENSKQWEERLKGNFVTSAKLLSEQLKLFTELDESSPESEYWEKLEEQNPHIKKLSDQLTVIDNKSQEIIFGNNLKAKNKL